MNKRSSAPARILAATALAVAFVIALVVIGSSLGGDDSGGLGGHRRGEQAGTTTQPKHVPAIYEVKSGDTLISIAHRTGVPVVRIQELNPTVDPQILIAGETLKLR